MGEAVLSVPDDTLHTFGWARVEVHEQYCPEALEQILGEMRSEPCTHSWRTFAHMEPGAAAVDQLIAWEQRRRPTIMFTYRGVDPDGTRHVIGMGAVSERINSQFPHTGFPVIARAYIRGPFRGQRLYTALLSHRYRYCQERWGAELRAVHLGSASDAVHHVVSNPEVASPPFRRVAVEALHVDNCIEPVIDYLAFQPAYADALLAATDPAPSDGPALRDGLSRLRAAVLGLLDGSVETDLFHFRALCSALETQTGWRGAERHDAIAGLLAFSQTVTPYSPPSSSSQEVRS